MIGDFQKFVLSRDLALESLDQETGKRNIVNTASGQRLEISDETMKLLWVFKEATTIAVAAKQLGMSGRGSRRKLRRLVEPLIKSNFLIKEIDEFKPIDLDKVLAEEFFIWPKQTFASCPLARPEALASGDIAIIGVGYDLGVTGNPGTRFGPDKVREVSAKFLTYERDIFTLKGRGWYNADLGRTILKDRAIHDLGNIPSIISEEPRRFYDRCFEAGKKVFETRALPVFIGGDHSITAPLFKAACQTHQGPITLVHLDAHTDWADLSEGSCHHHGNFLRQVVEEHPRVKVFQYGIRGFCGSVPGGNIWTVTQSNVSVGAPGQTFQIPEHSLCYISLDIDVLDPAFAPGVGTPVPLGMTPRELLKLLIAIAKNNTIVGIDVVELNPLLDQNDVTASLAVHLLMPFLDSIYRKYD